MNEQSVTIFLTPIEAELFLKFQKHHALFKLLSERGVFDQVNATILLDFDQDGVLQDIRRNDFLYSRRHELSTV